MGVILELPAELVNQIAAGEVIERPSSVLKELVENSLDSGAKRISVVTEGAGSSLIQVQDDGCGILRDDLPRAFLRHATSKIKSYDDLIMARTLGFRGEALASISSVSRITVETRHSSELVGSRMVLDPDKLPDISDWSGPIGSTISVRDLFFNVPVRKKYLKSPQTEQGHMVEALSRLAMGFFESRFDFSTVSRKLLSLPARDSAKLRILDLYPAFSEDDLVVHSRGVSDQAVTVFLLRPDKVRKDRQYQHLFINRRWIRHAGLFEAMTQGASGRLSRDVHVGAWVYLDLPPDKLDVNVHPTKKEVRFLEGDRLFSLVRRVVEESFPLFGEGKDVPVPPHELRPGSMSDAKDAASPAPELTGRADWGLGAIRNPDSLMTGDQFSRTESSGTREGSPEEGRMGGKKTFNVDLFRRQDSPGEEHVRPNFRRLPEVLKGLPLPFSGGNDAEIPLVVLGQLVGTYLVVLWGTDLGIVDWHTAHERVRYEKYRKELISGGVLKSPLVLPLVYKVALSVADCLDNRLEELAQIGFDLDRSGPDSFRVRSVPSLLKEEDPIGILNELASQSENFEFPVLRSDRVDHILMTMSCHESVRRNDSLDPVDGERLVHELLATPHPYTCPHGRPTILRLSRETLDLWFGR